MWSWNITGTGQRTPVRHEVLKTTNSFLMGSFLELNQSGDMKPQRIRLHAVGGGADSFVHSTHSNVYAIKGGACAHL